MNGKVESWMTSRSCVDCACLMKSNTKPAECDSCAFGEKTDQMIIDPPKDDKMLIICFEGQGHGLIEIPERFKEMIKDTIKYALDNMTEEEFDEEGLTGIDVTVEYGGKKYMLTSDWEEIYTDPDEDPID